MEWYPGSDLVLNDKVVLESCRLKPSICLLVEMRELGLWVFVHVEDERLAAKVLVEGVHSVQGIGHVNEIGWIVSLVVTELARRVRQHVEGTLFVDLAKVSIPYSTPRKRSLT